MRTIPLCPCSSLGIAAMFCLLALLLIPTIAKAVPPTANRYDVLYIWGNDLNNLQDYKEELEAQLGPDVGKKLRFVQRGDQYGIIYDCNTTALSAAKIAIRHSVLLDQAGLGNARAIKDENYHELYNVSYGHGPNLTVLIDEYRTIYRYLGSEIGKDLFIEKSDDGKFTLIYRRQMDRQSTMAVARRHAELLATIHLSASITPEENNEVVFGESSLLDHEEKTADATPAPAETAPVPVAANTKNVGEKVAKCDSDLEKRLEGYIAGLRRAGQVARDEKTGWLVIDLTRGETLVAINANRPYQAASMIKPFIALAYFHRLQEGKVVYGPKSHREMEAMIQHSSNSAANWILRQVGGPKAAQKLLRRHYSQLLRETNIVEYIPSGGRTYRNKASAKDYGRFLVALWRNQLPQSTELRRLMALPGPDRLYRGTPIPRGTMVYNKTGTTAKLCGDMGILAPRAQDGRRYPYVVVGIIEKQRKTRNYGYWQMARGNVIRHISTMIYQVMKTNYNLL